MKFVLAMTDAPFPAGVLAKVYRGPGALGDGTIVLSRSTFSRPLQFAAKGALVADFLANPNAASFRALELRSDWKVYTPEGDAKPFWMPNVSGMIDATITDPRTIKSETSDAEKTVSALNVAPTSTIDGRSVRWITM